MSFELPTLPYALDGLAPHLSKETLEYHYGKHHKAYVEKLNGFVQGTNYEKMPLEEVVIQSREKKEMKIFNNAAQHWNHSFYWNCLTPQTVEIPANVTEAIKQGFGSVERFEEQFKTKTTNLFGSGWSWLAQNDSGKLEIVETKDGENLLGTSYKPIMTCDVWEHAYYIDFRNARPKYVQTFWKLINWEFVQKNIESK